MHSWNVLCQPMQESRALLIILFHIHSILFQKNKKFKCLYQNRSADLADGLFLELCFHVRGDSKFFDYVLTEEALGILINGFTPH